MVRRRVAVIAFAIVVGLALAGFAERNALTALAIRTAVGALGYDFSADRVSIGAGMLAVLKPVVRNNIGEPVLAADRLEVAFSVRDLLPGSRARFGLRAVDLERPQLTLIHHADGTYNVALPQANGPPPRPDTTPFDVRIRVRDGTISLVDRFVVPNHERIESLSNVRADAILSPREPSYYRVDADLQDGSRRYPIVGRARFDHARRFASQHWHADELPVGPLINFAIATHAASLVGGRLRGVDARIYGFIHDDGTTASQISAIGELVDGKLFAAQLRSAVGDMHGVLRVDESGIDTTGIDATLAHVPLHLVGGIYDLSAPKLRFLLTGAGPLRQLRTVAAASEHRPIDGDLRFALRIDGPLTRPTVRGTFASPAISYDAYVLRDAIGTIAFSGEDFQIANVRADYGALRLSAGGALVLRSVVDSDIVVSVQGPSRGLPYAASILGPAHIDSIVHLTGTGTRLAGSGYVAGRGSRVALDAPFTLDPDGNGAIGPIVFQRADGARAYGRVVLNRRDGVIDGIVSAQRLALLPAAPAKMPGFAATAFPPIGGRLDVDAVGEVRGSQLTDAMGRLHIRRARVAGIALGDADAALTSDGQVVALHDLNVRGPLADIRANGVYANGVIAVTGKVRSSFERLAPLVHGVPAHGPINGWATIAMRGRTIDLRAARLDTNGGHIVATGSFGNGGTLHLTAGLPIIGGSAVGIASVTGSLSDPHAVAAFALRGGHIAGAPVAATMSAAYHSGRARIDDARLAYGAAVVLANGTVDAITSRTPQIDGTAQVRDADVATLARQFHLPLRYPSAAVDADMRVRGAATDPAVVATARIAAGSINGLAFHDVIVPVSGTMRSFDVRGARATVGSTTLHFAGTGSMSGARGTLRSDRIDLADFNDYFDAADTLAGRGHAAIAFGFDRASLSTSGDVALGDTRYRRLPIGDVDAHWNSAGRTIAANARVGGTHGRLTARGTATLPAGPPLTHVMASALDANATVSSLDLATWLPAVGIVVPVTGRLDGSAHVRGVAPNLAVNGNAALHDGLAGRMPIKRLTVAASAARGRTRITDARLEADNLVASASGTFGLGAADPVALHLRATSPDIVGFANRAMGTQYDASAALDTTLTVSGTRRAPMLHDVLDLNQPRYGRTTAKHARIDLAFGGGRLTLNDATADLLAGRISANAAVPATMSPPFIDRRNGPIAGRIRADGVDLAQFASLLPSGTKLGGIVNADVQVAGTMHDPTLGGDAQLSHGSYVSPLLASQITNGAVQIAFTGRSGRLATMHADVGGGTVDGDGTLALGDLRDPSRNLAFSVSTHEHNVGLDVPRLIRGKLNGTLAISHAAAAPILVAGSLDFSHTRIPLTALLLSTKSTPGRAPQPVAFDLGITASTDDRVQGPAVDVGAQGSVQLSGTLAKPALSGTITSTDGTISVYRTFVLQRASVAFDPSDGIVPMVDATATTHVPDPSTDVLLHAYGPATNLTLDLASRPEYDRSQIVGLLIGAQNLGAVSGVAQTSGASNNGSNPLQGVAVGYLNAQVTQSLFQPFSSSLGRSLGLSTLNLNAGLTGGFSASAARALSKNLETTFSQSQDTNGQRQSFGLALNLNDATTFQFTLFNAGTRATTVGVETPVAPTGPINYTLQSLAPPPGSNGYVFSYVHKFP